MNRRLLKPYIVIATLIFAVIITDLPAAAAEKEEELATKITSATVYANQAQVTRRGTVRVEPGLYHFACDDLPIEFVETSLQVDGRGSAKASILGIELSKKRGNASESPRYKELKGRLEELTAVKDSLTIHLGALKKRSEFLDHLSTLPFTTTEEKDKPDIFRVNEWKNLMDFLQSDRIDIDRKHYALGKTIREIEKEIEWIKGELNAMRAQDEWSKLIIIDCEVASAGDLTLDIRYVVPRTSWRPEYVIRYMAVDETIDLVYNARIAQSTGEDWEDVSVTLSTARPHVGAAPPVLRPHFLRGRPAVVRMGDEAHVRGGRKGEMKMRTDDMALPATVEAEGVPAEVAEAALAASAFAANFKIQTGVNLESGSDPRQVRILKDTFKGKLSRTSVPRLSRNAYTTGTVTNHLEVPILGGVAEVYIETGSDESGTRVSNFVGKETLATLASGEEFPIHLGIDQNIKVTHKLEKREYLEKGGKKKQKIRYHYLITIESFRKGPAEVSLKDRIPVSTMKEIEVDDIDLSPKPDDQKENGILTWKLSLVPGTKQEIRIAYTIVFPGDWPEHYINLD
jgi:uncharacterized protein (TIGR02231 family)